MKLNNFIIGELYKLDDDLITELYPRIYFVEDKIMIDHLNGNEDDDDPQKWSDQCELRDSEYFIFLYNVSGRGTWVASKILFKNKIGILYCRDDQQFKK